MIGVTFILATTTFVAIAWIIFLFGLITKRVKVSTMYGYLSISYISHALACQMGNLPWLFYFIFSVIFLLIYSYNKKVENNQSENDINKKEKDND